MRPILPASATSGGSLSALRERRAFLRTLAAAASWLGGLAGNELWAQAPAPRKVAFLVGVSAYDKRGFDNLQYAEKDMTALRDELVKQGFLVKLMLGSYAEDNPLRATRANLRTQLEESWIPGLKTLRKPDIALVAMSGHGLQQNVYDAGRKKTHDDQFFCPVDAAKKADAQGGLTPIADETTLLSVTDLMRAMSGASSCENNLVLIDACRDNAGKGVDGSIIQQLHPGLAMLFGATAGTKSYESDKLRHGVFSYYLLEGLRGAAADRDGEITWDGLVSHVRKEVTRNAPQVVNQNQRPNSVSNLLGEPPVLARVTNSRPSSTPTPMPPAPSLGNAKAGDERSDNGLSVKLVWCPPGTFTMGSPPGETDRSNDEGPVSVTLSAGFWLGKYEVTQGEWSRVMGTTPWQGKEYVKEGATYPATYVSWDEAVEFCRKLTEQERSAGRLASPARYRLPTEAEWEYACRAGTTSRFSFGEEEAELGTYAWYRTNAWDAGEKYAHEVGQKRPNRWGLYDMHGNVFEWCEDWYAETLPGGRDPVVTAEGSFPVLRGGSWGRTARGCCLAIRGVPPPLVLIYLGFRLALSPSGK